MKRYTTKKLFYGKWPYKVATYVLFGRVLLQSVTPNSTRWHSEKRITQQSEKSKQDLAYYASVMEEVVKFPNVKLRREMDTITYFTNSKDTANMIIDKLTEFVTEFHAPASDEEVKFLEDNVKTVIVNSLPYGRHQFKVILKYSMPNNTRDQLANWVTTNLEKLELFSGIKHFLFNTGWCRSPMMYVQDEQTMLMLRLVAGDHIQSVEKFILRSCINTKS